MMALALLASYLLGSIAFAVLVSRALRLSDPRTYGSGNPGATNVLRSGNRAAALLTLLGDAAKGALAVWIGSWIGAQDDAGWLAIACGAAAFAGHVFPVFLRFHGGKGVATYLGVLLAVDPWVGLATCATWLVVALASRYSSLASIASALAAPLIMVLLRGLQLVDTVILAAMSALLLWRHRSNIAKLRAGTESRIGRSPGSSPETG